MVGLYMNPPDNAVVLCVDEKSQIQALNRTQPMLPLRPGQAARGTPEYQRNGTTTLFAALDKATGNVIGKCFARHRAVEFRKFLNEIRRNVPPQLDVHIIVDNYATHSAPTIKRWLANNPRFHFHFIPTHSSWLNQVEGWFSILTTKQIKRGSHKSVEQLKTAIEEFLDAWNENPTPFKWTKSADRILANVARSCSATLQAHGNSQGTSLGDYGVNLVELAPGAWSAQRHWHSHEDEFIYVVRGELSLVTDAGEQTLGTGMAAGFPAGENDGHHLVNRGDEPAVYLEIGDRIAEDECHYPDIDLFLTGGAFVHKNGEPY